MAELKFLRGSYTNWASLTKDGDSFYIVEEQDGRFSLYLGGKFLCDGVSKADLANAVANLVNGASEGYNTLSSLEAKVKALETAVGGGGSVAEKIKTAIEALDKEVSGVSTDGLVTVKVTEVDGKLDTVVVTTNDIAKASELDALEAAVGGGFSAEDTVAAAIATNKKAIEDEVARAQSAENENADAIAVLKGDAETVGSVAKAVATEKARAEAKELELNNAITAETTARENAIAALDAEVTSNDGTYVTVKVTEVDGVITAVNVTESGIASAQALIDEKARAEAAEKVNADAIESEAETARQAEAALTRRVQAIESAPYATQADVTTETDRAKAAEKVNADAISAEKTRAEGAESALSGRLSVIEGEGEGSVKKALADAKEYADTKIGDLDATITGEGTYVDVTVAQANGVITAVTVAESGIASAAVLAEVKKDVDNFFKDASFTESAKDTLKELQDYINTDAAGALAMEKAIADNKTAIEAEVTRAKDAEAQALTDAKAYTDTEVQEEADRAKAAEKANADAISAEKTRAEGKESELATAIANETTARKDADDAINATIGTVDEGKTVVEMIKAAEAAAIAAATIVAEDSEFITIEQTGEVGKTQTYTIKTQDVASASATTAAIAAETKAREDAMTAETATRVAAEAQVLTDAKAYTDTEVQEEADRAKGKEDELETRLATVEGDYVKSVEAVTGSMIKVEETEQKVTLSLQWGTF